MATELEDMYHRFLTMDPQHRRQWILDQRPACASPAAWWYPIADSAVTDVRRQILGLPSRNDRPQADFALAVSLIDWAREQNYPWHFAIEQLALLTALAFGSGQEVDGLPHGARPDEITRKALNDFGMTRREALCRAAELRARPVTEEDFVPLGEDPAISMALFSELEQTNDYRDYHRLLNIAQALVAIAPLADRIRDAHIQSELHEWLRILAQLDPFPT